MLATFLRVPASVRNRVGGTLKRIGEQAGLEVRRHLPPGPRRAELLRARGVELAIDVGANRGQYGEELRSCGYSGRIVSFEPLSDAFEVLSRRAADDPRWTVERLAISDTDQQVELGAADNFSSLLPPSGRLAELFPEANPRRAERVQARRLDRLGLVLPGGRRTLLKLDVQGYERAALTGAAGILGQIGIVETELSLAALYDGQPLMSEMVCLLQDQGYALTELNPVLRDRTTGRHLQFDGWFVRE